MNNTPDTVKGSSKFADVCRTIIVVATVLGGTLGGGAGVSAFLDNTGQEAQKKAAVTSTAIKRLVARYNIKLAAVDIMARSCLKNTGHEDVITQVDTMQQAMLKELEWKEQVEQERRSAENAKGLAAGDWVVSVAQAQEDPPDDDLLERARRQLEELQEEATQYNKMQQAVQELPDFEELEDQAEEEY